MTFRRVLDENDYKGADLVWLLVVDWGGAIYRFSNIPVEIAYDNGDYLFEGQLDQLDYQEESDLFELSVEANSVSVAVVFPHNMVQEFRSGRILDGARAELSYIMVRNGQPLQTRVRLVNPLSETLKSPKDLPLSVSSNSPMT
jgi:hypothetical protein